jgi:hypothetical protein
LWAKKHIEGITIIKSKMASLSHIMLDKNKKFNGQNFKSWKQKMLAIFEYRCLDKLVLGKEIWSETNVDAQEKYDAKNREVVMLIKLSVTNEMLPEVQDGNDAFVMWGNLWKMHETSNKGRVFFLKNMLFSIKMEEFDSLQDHLLKIKDIRDQLKSIERQWKKKIWWL